MEKKQNTCPNCDVNFVIKKLDQGSDREGKPTHTRTHEQCPLCDYINSDSVKLTPKK